MFLCDIFLGEGVFPWPGDFSLLLARSGANPPKNPGPECLIYPEMPLTGTGISRATVPSRWSKNGNFTVAASFSMKTGHFQIFGSVFYSGK